MRGAFRATFRTVWIRPNVSASPVVLGVRNAVPPGGAGDGNGWLNACDPMIRTFLRLLVPVLVATAAAAPLRAQPARDSAAAAGFREDAARRPFDALLRHRGELRLSAQQVRQIESVARRLEERNAPLRERLVHEHRRWREERRTQLERMSPGERRRELRRLRERRGAGEQVPEPLRPVVREMLVNIEQAIHDAQGVLTAEQRLQARQILRREIREDHVRARRPLRGRRQP